MAETIEGMMAFGKSQQAIQMLLPFLAAFFVSIFSSVAFANVYVEPSVSLVNQTVNVQAGSYTYYSFNLPTGGQLSAKFTVSGGLDNKIGILLLDLPNFQRYIAHQQYSYFRGTSGIIQGVASYDFNIPQNGLYYLVLDNTQALMLSRKVNLYVYAVSPVDTPPGSAAQESIATILRSSAEHV